MVKAGFRKHVIPTLDGAVAWDLCFLEPDNKAIQTNPFFQD